MNAFNAINISAACILTSTDYARQLGIPESRWIYPLGGAGTRDSYDCERFENFYPLFSASADYVTGDSLGSSKFLFKSSTFKIFRRSFRGFWPSNRPD